MGDLAPMGNMLDDNICMTQDDNMIAALRACNARLVRQNEKLLRDKVRLDWMLDEAVIAWPDVETREDIDKAMEESK